MLRAGIVGLSNSSKYIKILEKLGSFTFSGIYDPSFQIDLSLYNSIEKGFLDFKALIESSDIIIFTSDDKVFFQLMKDALSNSKSIFLDSVHKYSYSHLNELSKMAYEANSFVQVCHPDLFHEVTAYYLDFGIKPIVIQESIEVADGDKLLKKVREDIIILLNLVDNKIRRIRTSISSTKTAIPNIYQVNLEFNNGCSLNLLASSVSLPFKKDLRIVGKNSNSNFQYDQHLIEIFNENELTRKQYNSSDNTIEKLITRQLEAVYLKQINHNYFDFSLEKEMEACLIIQKITDQLKVCMSIV